MKIDDFAKTVMRRMYEDGVPQTDIARYFDVSAPTVNYHVNGITKAWKRGRYLKSILSRTPDGTAVSVAARYTA